MNASFSLLYLKKNPSQLIEKGNNTMAKNKNLEPVESESSDDEETDASSDEETVKKPNNTVPNKPSSTPPVNKTPTPNSSDEESDSDSQPTTNNKITTHQPDSSDESESDSEPKPSVTPSKRLAEPTTKAAAKKPKIVTEPEKKVPESNSKKVLFQRLWSDEDEIVILNGMIEFEAKNNVSPTSDLDSFLGYIKKDLHVNVDVSKTQLLSKIRKLKKRYENNKGKDKNLMKPHEKATFEFSEKLWGGGAASSGVLNGSVVRNTSKKGKNVKKEEVAMEVPKGGSDKKKDVVMEVSNGGLKKALVRKMSSSFGLSNEEKLLRIGAEMFGGEEKIAGLEEWKKLEREGMELSLKELDVKRAKMKLVLDAME